MLALGMLTACSQNKSRPTPAKAEMQPQAKANDSTSNAPYPIPVSYSDKYDELPKLIQDTIKESEFVAAYHPPAIDSVVRDSDKEHFYITTSLGRKAYLKYDDRNDGKSWFGYVYVGYYGVVGLYAVISNSTSTDFLEFGTMELVNSKTGMTYRLLSLVGDSAVDTPILSPDKNYFVYFQNADFETNDSEICILKIDPARSLKKYLQPVASYRSNQFLVDKICWGKNGDIYIKVYTQNYINDSEQWIRTYKFFRGHW